MTTPSDPLARLLREAAARLYQHRDDKPIGYDAARNRELRDELNAAADAHDTAQPGAGADQYPTPWAYEQACKALHIWRAKADERRLAMVKAQDTGCVDHLDCCDDAGDFWHMAMNDPIFPKDSK